MFTVVEVLNYNCAFVMHIGQYLNDGNIMIVLIFSGTCKITFCYNSCMNEACIYLILVDGWETCSTNEGNSLRIVVRIISMLNEGLRCCINCIAITLMVCFLLKTLLPQWNNQEYPRCYMHAPPAMYTQAKLSWHCILTKLTCTMGDANRES